MSGTATCVHAVDGRLRIKVPAIKRDPTRAQALEAFLRSREGVDSVSVNPTTGSVVIWYDQAAAGQEEILHSLKEMGFRLQKREEGSGIFKGVALGLTEFAFQRLFTVLIF